MIFQENFRFFDFWDAIESGLYFVIVGYYFLLFAYFLLMRFRTSKKLYWLFFSLLFLCLAASRVFFIASYFFLPELVAPPEVIAGYLMLTYRLATFFTWLAIACLMGVLGMLIWPPEADESQESSSEKFMLSSTMKISMRIILIIIPIFIGILALTLPDNLFMDPEIAERYDVDIELHTIYGYPIGRFLLNFILAPIFMAAIPFLFLYLAWKTFGVLRKSYLLNAIGFFLYYAGRILQGVFEVAGWPHLRATVPPLIILCSLLIIVIANNFEQLR